MEYLADHGLSFSTVESASFRKLITASTLMPHNITMSRDTVTEKTVVHAKKVRDSTIKDFLAGSTRYVTLAIDGWTNVRKAKVYNVMLLRGGNAYYYKSIENVVEKNGTAYIVNALDPIIMELLDQDVNIVAMVTDNEAAIIGARKS